MTRDPIDRPAPDRLELVRAFVNTLDIDRETDLLDDPEAARRWFEAAGLLPAEALMAQPAFAETLRAREAFRAVLVANARGGRPNDAVDVLNRIAAEAGIVVRFTGPASTMPVVTKGGSAGALGQLVSIAMDSISRGTWARLKACPAQACNWAFYDQSRNRSSRWCDMGLCGNRSKSDTFRGQHDRDKSRS